MNYNNSTILITGCSSGIGYETALYLHEKGYKVFATARQEKDVLKLKNLGLTSFLLDVTKPKTITDTLDKITQITGGKLDVVFNNAGFGQPGALEDVTTDVLKEQFETNVFGLHEVTIQVLKIMKQQGYGTIIQHSSVLGLISLKFKGPYNASKYAIEGLTDTLRLELKNTNINVTLLNTGPVTSDFRKNAIQKTLDNINIGSSRFREEYHKSMSADKSVVPFNLEAIEVSKIVEKIICSKKVKPRYYITKATYILGFAKRILSTSKLDFILNKL
jgi:short-subunit dehydrogenase